MRFPRCTTTAAAAFMFATFPALAQTNGTPAPTPATTQQPGAGQLPDVNGQAGGPTHEMIRQMIEQAVQERMQQDRSSNEGNNRQEEGDNRQQEASRHGDGWRWHRNGGPAGEHGMVGNHGPRMMRGTGMRLVLALLDTDGDGSLSENEVQEAVGRIFSAIDQNGDGKIDMDEIQSFSHGSGGREEMP
ncbi:MULTISPECIES: EF-hand domain-containing protein [unclassified Mesorhizobium]|uniref:EF-hand domain-containing protein n=1 Tax=unclassified Mesorhizobium TaxID=325217 RepID=UPI00112B62FE|nr:MULTISPECIES: EF-hand domain-containing protein [unclassified Mesorhizobium]TPK90724.1 EF-hand domain-containing protein [Mesorhizobium sp. B2-4-17]TPL08971.1 EF-hand domain-containing protein [Mesorhizobium sp. B2-4-14]